MSANLFINFEHFCRNKDFCYCDVKEKQKFHRDGKKVLKAIAEALNLKEYDLRSNKAGIAVSGEITLHGDNIYVQISKNIPGKEIMFRACDGHKDYCGKQNHFISLNYLANNPKKTIEVIYNVMQRGI